MKFPVARYLGLFLGTICALYLINTKKYFFDEFNADKVEKKIFFIESNFKRTFFDQMQLCAIESAAKHNPTATISVISVKGVIDSVFNEPLIRQYPNIELEVVDATEVFEGTPLEEWWLNDRVTKLDDYYRVAHTSDALRLAFMYKHGGLYSDCDTIALRSFDMFFNHSAFFLERDDGVMINSFFIIAKRHPFLKHLMEMFVKEYDPKQWALTGPELFMRHLPVYCGAPVLDLLTDKQQNATAKCDIVVFPKRYAYALHWYNVGQFFAGNHPYHATRFLDAYSLHFHSKMSGGRKNHWNSSNIYEFFANYNCPLTVDISRLLLK
jgi:hypothetical protein